MKNEIYEKAMAIAKEAEQQIRDYLSENFKDAGMMAYCEIKIHEAPESLMPEDSVQVTSENEKYLRYYSTVPARATMFSKTKKGKPVFDEPATSNVKPETILS